MFGSHINKVLSPFYPYLYLFFSSQFPLAQYCPRSKASLPPPGRFLRLDCSAIALPISPPLILRSFSVLVRIRGPLLWIDPQFGRNGYNLGARHTQNLPRPTNRSPAVDSSHHARISVKKGEAVAPLASFGFSTPTRASACLSSDLLFP